MVYMCSSCQDAHKADKLHKYCQKCNDLVTRLANRTKEESWYIDHQRQIEDLEKKVRETEEILNRRIHDLTSSLTFLSVSNAAVSPPPLADIVLVASDDPSPLSISANRAVLACRSPVFRAMLETEMAESISGMIMISEVSNETLGMFVSFMYTAEANLDDVMACDLLMLGEKYQIPHLKTYCEKFLSSVLNWENSLRVYAFARQNNSQGLMDASLSLIMKNIQKLSKKEDYAQYAEKDPRMVLEIYEAYKF